jgi:hypothetical protein
MDNLFKKIKLTAEETLSLLQGDLNDMGFQFMMYGLLTKKYNIDTEKYYIGYSGDHKYLLLINKGGKTDTGSSVIE